MNHVESLQKRTGLNGFIPRNGFLGRTPILIILVVLGLLSCSKSPRTPEDLMRLVASRQMHTLKSGGYLRGDWQQVLASRLPEGVRWTYPWGVTLYGLLRLGAVLDDSAMTAFVLEHNRIAADQYAYLTWQKDRFGRWAGDGGLGELMTLDRLDYCGSMTSQMLEGILCHHGAVTVAQDSLIRTVADYIGRVQDRLPDGTLWRPKADSAVWADDLYMSCPFLARYAEYAKDERFLTDAARQILGMASRLQDRDGVWFHGYVIPDSAVSGFKWCRANGWAMIATAEVLSVLPQSHPLFDSLRTVFKKHIEGIARLQAPSGRWRQVLDRPELWEETSSTAMFMYCICRAVNRGWIDPAYFEAARKAFKGLDQKITPEGGLLDVCEGTGIGHDLAFYQNRQRPFDDHHGQGAVLLALSEYTLALRRQP